ncbi:murein L,D-transpeptidase, partial [Streptomyces sp. 8K308]
MGAAGCGTADSLEPDRGPRPALTTDATPEAPEPDQEITDPSPDEGLTTTVPEQREEEPPAEPEPEPEPTTA